MEKIQFKVTLLSDVVLSGSSATESQHHCLDFIPGGVFLGIAAKSLYDKEDERTWLIFHSGKVRFGDAHPSHNQIRGHHIPADLYYPKLGSLNDKCYVNHLIEDHDKLRPLQLKQCRNDYYVFDGGNACEVKNEKQFTLKTAYNTERHGARGKNGKKGQENPDEALFGYESMGKGSTFYFEVELDDEALAYKKEIIDALRDDHHIGRSRTAQYGWVNIEEAEYKEGIDTLSADGDEVTVYADGRLIFLDEIGLPTFQPTASDLGFNPDAHIDWSKSQVRTFQYAPWNFKRQAFDNDRCGIEKGSVFIVKSVKGVHPKDGYVGAYQNEGFGKVFYNPSLLAAKAGENGISEINFISPKKSDTKESDEEVPEEKKTQAILTPEDNMLLAYVKRETKLKEQERKLYDDVDNFVRNNLLRFQGERFASQWGTIRGIAMASKNNNVIDNIKTYLDHGVAKEQWNKWKRLDTLQQFMDNHKDEGNLRELIINLASEMAKKCRKEEK